MGWEEWKNVYVAEKYKLNNLEFKLEKYIYISNETKAWMKISIA